MLQTWWASFPATPSPCNHWDAPWHTSRLRWTISPYFTLYSPWRTFKLRRVIFTGIDLHQFVGEWLPCHWGDTSVGKTCEWTKLTIVKWAHLCWYKLFMLIRVANPIFSGFWAWGLSRSPPGHPPQAGQTVEGKKSLKKRRNFQGCSVSVKVSLDYRPAALGPTSGTTSVFRISTGNGLDYGSRIAFIHGSGDTQSFWIASPINGEANYAKPGPIASPPVGDWCNIEVRHQVVNCPTRWSLFCHWGICVREI